MQSEIKDNEANRYFFERVNKVFIERCNNLGIEKFEGYLKHGYQDSCYNYSLYALMGLKPEDVLLRGFIDVNERGRSNYHHGWVEFDFEGDEYVFDNHFTRIVPKEEWYELRKPDITYRKTQKEILDQYLNETYAFKVDEYFWQMKKVIYAGYKDYHQLEEARKENKKEGYVPGMLERARIVLSSYNGEVIRFIAYDPPSC